MRSSQDIQDEISALTLDLNALRNDAALMERLRNAAREAPRLAKRLDELTALLIEAQTRESVAKGEVEKATFRNFVATPRYSTGQQGQGFPAGFTITYERFVRDRYGNGWVQREATGFQSLQPDVLDWLLKHSPQSLPAEIANLAPGDPYAAFESYQLALRRGHFGA